ncbi:Planctomycete cytochrome C [Rubripirellula obstinata]|uniref:Planctomycete cytochrome C n=1 Tax=Rubripirellula obstinata TaxID=406547 RepID=A0A5B1CFA3_9BACT|nr:c-type cytochrome domain-containing protein [Rubripirellula obstinata]KAA1259877.1 Planctomycete cytochrome C [Rubripirellula obstinata]
MRVLLVLLVCFSWATIARSADAISLSDRKLISEINQAVGQAGKHFAAGEHEQAGQSIQSAMAMVGELGSNSPELVGKIQPAISRIQKAHMMLEFEGVMLPPFQPPRLALEEKKTRKTKTVSAKRQAKTPVIPKADPFSFANAVAPILDKRCGRCHIDGARGGFSMTSFAALMKGPPEGVVIFPGDNVGSRLIETIETGDMPRGGGKVTPAELQILKTWISKGALFDGNDPSVPIRSIKASVGSAPTTADPMNNANVPMKAMKATGKETVSFAKDVAGLLIDNCKGCHIDAMQTRGGLNMDSFATLLRGGDSGSMINPGNAEASLLIKKLRGTEGDRMPGGGRPPLSESDIQLVATWINEGATLDGDSDRQPLRVMNQLAWAASASASELSRKRSKTAEINLKLVASTGVEPQSVITDHFLVTGTASKKTLELVGSLAEKQIKTVESVVPESDGPAEDFYRGKATIYVLPKRYDYSEFSKMVERRGIPSEWQSHWRFDGIDGYVAMVATERDDAKEIESRLVTPLTALAIATRGSEVPRWFAEGVGVVTSMRKAKLDREERMRIESETATAVSAMKDAKSFLDGKMSPEQADRIGAAIATTLLSRNQRRNYDQLLQELEKGGSFETAFAKVFRATPKEFIDTWLKYVR